MLVLARDKFRCKLCGAASDEGFRNIVIHHIDGSKDNNSLGNLVTLCRKCHPTVHNRWNGTLRTEELRQMVARKT